MLFAKFDLESLDDPAFLDLYDADPGHPWRFLRLVQFAKRNGTQGGLVQRADGQPVTPRQMARLHDPRHPQGEQIWLEFLKLCVELQLLETDGTNYTIAHWRRWHTPPSDDPSESRERQRECREQRRERKRIQEANAQRESVTTCHEVSRGVTRCHDQDVSKNFCVTPVTTQSRAEQSRAEHNRAEQSSPSSRARAREGPTDGDFLSIGENFLREINPGAVFGKQKQKELETITQFVGKYSFGGEVVREDDVKNAMMMAARMTKEKRQKEGVTNPWNYWIATACQKVHDCVEARFTMELQQRLVAERAGEHSAGNRGDTG